MIPLLQRLYTFLHRAVVVVGMVPWLFWLLAAYVWPVALAVAAVGAWLWLGR